MLLSPQLSIHTDYKTRAMKPTYPEDIS